MYCTCVHINFTAILFRTHNSNNNVHVFMYTRTTPNRNPAFAEKCRTILPPMRFSTYFNGLKLDSNDFFSVDIWIDHKLSAIVLHLNVHDEVSVYVFASKYVVAGFYDWTNMALSTHTFGSGHFMGVTRWTFLQHSIQRFASQINFDWTLHLYNISEGNFLFL